MRNKLLLSVALLTVMTMSAAARTIKYVELGVNRSTFRNESCTPGYGISGGVGIDYYPFSKFGGFVGSGLELHNKKMVLRDRIWEPNVFQSDPYYKTGDIHINVLYFDLPIHIGYAVLEYKHFTLSVFGGYDLIIPLHDYSTAANVKKIKLEKDANGEYDYDYDRVEGRIEGYESYCIGFKILYHNFTLKLSMERALMESKASEVLYILDEMDNYIFTIGYVF